MHRNIFFHDSRAREKGAMIIELWTQSIGHEIIQWNMNKNIKGSCSDRKLITVFFPSLRKRITTLRLLRQLTMLKFIKAFEKWTNELKACQVQWNKRNTDKDVLSENAEKSIRVKFYCSCHNYKWAEMPLPLFYQVTTNRFVVIHVYRLFWRCGHELFMYPLFTIITCSGPSELHSFGFWPQNTSLSLMNA